MAHHTTIRETEVRGIEQELVEVWCPEKDEEKAVLYAEYVNHCPVCGTSIEVSD